MNAITAATQGFTVEKGGQDEKYHKRRKQKKEERLKQALLLFGFALSVLVYTWWTLLEVPETSSSAAYHPINEKTSRKKEKKRRGLGNRRKTASSSSNSKSSLGEAVGNLFRSKLLVELEEDLKKMDHAITANVNGGIRWVRPDLLPALDPSVERPLLAINAQNKAGWSKSPRKFFHVKRFGKPMAWEDEDISNQVGPKVDFTKHSYTYPDKMMEPPATLGEYPKLVPLKDIMAKWPQDDIDHPPTPFQESLIHFDYGNPQDMEAAQKFRDAKLPFKVVNVPEVDQAGLKWTDEYVTANFDYNPSGGARSYPLAKGTAQESSDNFFAFYAANGWPVEQMGIPPTRNSDWTFEKWAEHARYADATGLDTNQPHFYWQSGVDREERHSEYSQWTFISRDLPSFSSPTATFFIFEPELQKGIQCRFGERGVTAATHFDAGRNMVAMMTGAKRYILSPPKQCSNLGIVPLRGSPIWRHSLLNFGHMAEMDNPDMPSEEKEWLERSGDALALDTVLKAGEVMYIPSHWFHYITSLQKSAQCNVRSGVDAEGDDVFGGQVDVTDKCIPA